LPILPRPLATVEDLFACAAFARSPVEHEGRALPSPRAPGKSIAPYILPASKGMPVETKPPIRLLPAVPPCAAGGFGAARAAEIGAGIANAGPGRIALPLVNHPATHTALSCIFP
jgi:hypothetical protein